MLYLKYLFFLRSFSSISRVYTVDASIVRWGLLKWYIEYYFGKSELLGETIRLWETGAVFPKADLDSPHWAVEGFAKKKWDFHEVMVFQREQRESIRPWSAGINGKGKMPRVQRCKKKTKDSYWIWSKQPGNLTKKAPVNW